MSEPRLPLREHEYVLPAFLRGRHTPCMDYSDVFDRAGDTLTHRSAQLAKRVCRRCPLLYPCQEHALREGEAWGVWGGMTAEERQALDRNVKRRGVEKEI